MVAFVVHAMIDLQQRENARNSERSRPPKWSSCDRVAELMYARESTRVRNTLVVHALAGE